ncbi:cytochrome d ubiquinol oxidase subunit II [Trinickia caryophylli]|uniref:Cytochrome d ubiquinol oxidase subunit II n=1 Tax=Trinickia caryophylli TaxID=28094 RepID=A0A1X7HAK4_TRICW|nr:cytochrome d ubiquinol oxidase subunit II [Trinickia caryophylli]PMS08705.1 cytochrome d ubiquinol oxidase subunit II [Trinickia caryophylli]TRX18290.1 cytochrome d ubiquinol oxidase subunit II [Trinickia caryophylli]WQE10924.1 cytochrome d ubiquinol oxidase subunit II [Trinickia caryophylli]SMF82835.1 cytochrome d ubiquinol oxidase subunit II [Trinickia caryophylli]GLU35866.1 cytochrome oxidase [Trinickia caryophylli]
MDASTHSMLAIAWFGLIGLMLAIYVIADGFDLGIGMLSLLRPRRADRDVMALAIGQVWDANETWLVVLGGALFGAFPAAYSMLLQALYLPFMALIAGLIMRGAAIEFRHSAEHGPLFDRVFGLGSLLAAVAQGIILGKVITAFAPGAANTTFVTVSAIGVVTGYSLLGATYLVKKTVGAIEQWARRVALLSASATVACALVLTAATWLVSDIGRARWGQPGVFHLLLALGAAAALAFAFVMGSLYLGGSAAPFRASVALFLFSFAGLAASLFPDFVPGKLAIVQAASDSPTLVFMLIGIGLLVPVMIGYNVYQYTVFRGKVRAHPQAGD